MARGAAPPLDPEALRDARLAARLSQAALARAAGTDRRQIIRYENGSERPEIARLAALARACSVTVADLVDEDALPPGLAGLRIGAGLTLAAAATALGARLDPKGEAEIATNRASLSYAERGRMPLSWRPSAAETQVRDALGEVYEADADTVRAAWRTTFPAQTNPDPDWDPLPETLWAWLCRAAAAPGATTAELGGPYWLRHLVEGPVKGGRGPGRGFLQRRPAPSGAAQQETWYLTEAGRAHILAHREDYARLYPEADQPRLVRQMSNQSVLGEEPGPAGEGVTQAPPPPPSMAETAVLVWGSSRPASQPWRIRARIREADGTEVEATATNIEGRVPVVGWWTSRRGLSRTVHGQVIQALEWTSPWRSMPEAAPNLPGARPAPQAGAMELPLDAGQEEPHQATVDKPTLERATEDEVPELLAEEERIYRVRSCGQLLGWVWREDDGKEWGCLRADAEGHPHEILIGAPRRDRRTRAQAVGLLLERFGKEGPSPAWGPIPRAHPAEPSDGQPESAPSAKTTPEVDMSEKIGPGWTLRRQGTPEEHTWLLLHEGRERGTVRRYRPRSGDLSRGWEALAGAGGAQGFVRRPATKQGKFGQRSSFLWRSRDLAAWGIATNPDFAQPNPEWARRPRR
ncbi:helix-turn-helix transcriptional regulator [Nocardiopsis terrae]